MIILEKKIRESYADKVALITGSSKGVGEKIAIYLASLGFKLVITGRDEKRIRTVAEKCRQLSENRVLVHFANLLNDFEVENLVNKTIEEFGKIDFLINSANITIPCSINDPNIMESYGKVINTNVRSVVLLTSLLVPYLEKTRGCVINVMSDSGSQPYDRELPFDVSEAALVMFTRSLALELRSKGIRVLSMNSALVLSPDFSRNPWLSATIYSRL